MYLFPLIDWMENFPVWLECILTDGIYGWLIVAHMSIVSSSCFWSSVVDCGLLYWEFFLVLSWWTSDVRIEWGRNLRMLLSVMNSHVDRLLSLMAFRSVPVVGIPMDQWRKVRVHCIVPYGRTALICGSNFGMDGWGLDAFGNLHRLVAGSLYSVKIVRPPFIPVHVVLWTLLHTCCHIVRELDQGVLAYFWIYMPVLRSPEVRPFSFVTECVLQLYSRLVAVPLLALFVNHSGLEYSCINNLIWRHCSL